MAKQSLVQSFRNAFAGIGVVFWSQRNARIQLAAAVVVILLGVFLKISPTEWAILILTIAAVLAAEAINTAIEAVVDLMSPEYHQQARIAKDTAAAAVLIISIGAVLVGLCILGPPIVEFAAYR